MLQLTSPKLEYCVSKQSKIYQKANDVQENPATTEHSAIPSPFSSLSLLLHRLRWTQILATDFWVLFFRKLYLASTCIKKDIMTFVKENFASPLQKKMRFLHSVFYILLKGKVEIGPGKILLMKMSYMIYFHRLPPITPLS